MKLIKSMTILALFLFVTGLGWVVKGNSQVREPKSKVELLRSDNIAIGYARMEKNGRQASLQYKLTNVLDVNVSNLAIEMVSYDLNGEMLRGGRWVLRMELSPGAIAHGTLAINPAFLSAPRTTVKFIPSDPAESSGDGISADCSPNFCDPNGACGSMSGKCKKPPISVECQIGSPCICNFECG